MLNTIVLAATAALTLGGATTFMAAPAAAQADHFYPFYEHVPVSEPGIGVIINWASASGNKFMDGGFFKSSGSALYAETSSPGYLHRQRHHRYGY